MNNYLLRNAATFITVLLLTSCSQKVVKFVPEQPSISKGSVIYIYRPNALANIVVSPGVIVDGEKKFDIKNDAYNYFYLPAGQHHIELDLPERFQGNKSVGFSIEPNSIKYFRITTSMKFEMNKLYGRTFDISEVLASEAVEELAECEYLGNKKSMVQNKVNTDDSQRLEEKPDSPIDDPGSKFSISKTRNPFSK